MSDNSPVIHGASAALGPASDLTPMPPYIANGTATFINRGAAADIWLVETSELNYISKTLRLSPDFFPTSRSRVQGDESSIQPNDPAQKFIQDFRFKSAQWAALRHRNLVKVFRLSDRLDMRVEYCENGTAHQYLEKYNRDQHKRILMIEGILEGIIYLHAQTPSIVHGSLKADNIFVAADGTAKIGEFGLSSMTRSFALLAPSISQAGLSRWMSPELVDIDPDDGVVVPTTASDIWALGCTFMEILSGEIPYQQQKHELRVRRAIIAGQKPWPTESGVGEEFSSIWPVLIRCWETSPGGRPSASAIKAFRLLDGPIARSSTTSRNTLADPWPAAALPQTPPRAVKPYASPSRAGGLLPVAQPSSAQSPLSPPRQAPSTWKIFFTEYIQNWRDKNPNGKPVVSLLAKEAGAAYKALTSEQKEATIRAKEEYEFRFSEWENTLTPEDVHTEHALRAARRRAGKSRRLDEAVNKEYEGRVPPTLSAHSHRSRGEPLSLDVPETSSGNMSSSLWDTTSSQPANHGFDLAPSPPSSPWDTTNSPLASHGFKPGASPLGFIIEDEPLFSEYERRRLRR